MDDYTAGRLKLSPFPNMTIKDIIGPIIWKCYQDKEPGLYFVNIHSSSIGEELGNLNDCAYCKPSPEVIQKLRDTFCFEDSDTFYFEIIDRADGRLLVASRNEILATRWLVLEPKTNG